MIDYQIFETREALVEDGPKLIKRIGAFWNFETKLVIRYEPFTERRSRSQLALYRVWLRHMADHFSTKGNIYTEDDMHDLCRHKFLGYEDRKIGNTEIQAQLKSTAAGKIGRAEMSEYMHQIEAWCTELGCYLPYPEDNDYSIYRRARQ
jgi:hypothetical protein